MTLGLAVIVATVLLPGMQGLAAMVVTLAAIFILLQSWCGIPLAALFCILALALLTGGFHLDGLADTCDGIFSARRRERMLEIMRDSRLGTHGGLALIFVLLAKILVVSELALRGTPMLAALAAACAAGRGSAVLLMYRHRYARDEGLGNVFIGKVSGRQTCITLGLAVIVATVLLPGMQGLAAMVVTLAAIFILGQLLKRTLGGQTGDTLGAAIELGELIFLLALL
nr:adenosylcobinamide-GDP ribazoletransferase [Salmonella enterica]